MDNKSVISDEEIDGLAFKNADLYSKREEEHYIKLVHCFIDGFNTKEESKSDAVDFAEWIFKNSYSKYFGNEGENCDKWYKQYTQPSRKYYTGQELFELFLNSK